MPAYDCCEQMSAKSCQMDLQENDLGNCQMMSALQRASLAHLARDVEVVLREFRKELEESNNRLVVVCRCSGVGGLAVARGVAEAAVAVGKADACGMLKVEHRGELGPARRVIVEFGYH